MKKISDSDLLAAMSKSVNNDLNIDPLNYKTIESIEIKNPTKVNGQYLNHC